MAWLETLRREAGRWTARGLDLVLPPRCGLCGAEAEPGPGPVCDTCGHRVPGTEPRCPACGAPATDGQPCRRCRGRARDWDGIAVLGGYADELRDAVLAAKRPAGEPQQAALAALLLRRHAESFAAWRLDLVVPVPMHWLRRATRGTSAAEGIARGVARGLGLACRSVLRRRRATRMQNELPSDERRDNVRGAFAASAAAAGRRILLVDDVTTTGGTLADCRRALVAAGAAAVYAAVAARADAGAEAMRGTP